MVTGEDLPQLQILFEVLVVKGRKVVLGKVSVRLVPSCYVTTLKEPCSHRNDGMKKRPKALGFLMLTKPASSTPCDRRCKWSLSNDKIHLFFMKAIVLQILETSSIKCFWGSDGSRGISLVLADREQRRSRYLHLDIPSEAIGYIDLLFSS